MGRKLDCHRKKRIYGKGSETFAFQWTTNDNPIHTCSLETVVNCVMLSRGMAFFIHETLMYVPSYGRIVYLVCPAQVADAPFGRVAPHSRKTIRDLFIYWEECEDTKGVIRIHWDYWEEFWRYQRGNQNPLRLLRRVWRYQRGNQNPLRLLRRVWRYQRSHQNPYIEEQTTQWLKEKAQMDKQRSTNHTYKTKDRVTRTPLKNRGWTQVLRKGKQFMLH